MNFFRHWHIYLLALPLSLRAAQPPPEVKFSLPPPRPAVVEPEAAAAEAEAPPVERVAESVAAAADPVTAAEPATSVGSILELQVELHRRGFSCGSIDGTMGAQTIAALRAWQRSQGIRESGALDDPTRAAMALSAPALGEHVFTEEELSAIQPMPETWVGKSERENLGYATPLELAAERHRASPKLLQQLNPETDWPALAAGASVRVPAVERVSLPKKAARILIWLEARELEVVDANGATLAHFPVSIARMVEKRPVGELHVTVIAPEPNYTFDPAVFPESAEAKELGRKLILPPGPNNPVGRAWIGLDRPGFGIHGTPEPEKVGRTESHGCFRLANWDAVALLAIVRTGLTVVVEP